jgi:CRP-like cAMP-binding protein
MTSFPNIADHQTALMSLEPAVVSVLDADPDLAMAVDPRERQLAARCSVARAFSFPRGPWTFMPDPDAGGLGALILRGLILVRVEVGDRAHAELLGEGDVISPWVRLDGDLAVPSTVTAKIVDGVRVALLDRHFALRTGRWPEVHAALFHRLILRSRRLSLQSAINAIPRTTDRLELTLWHLAYHFGRVAPGGIRLRLPLSHAQLAEIVATQRPSVTIGLARMEESGRLKRSGPHDWLLCGQSPAELQSLTRQCGLTR